MHPEGRSCYLQSQAILELLSLLNAKLVYMGFAIQDVGTVLSVKYVVVVKDLQIPMIGTVTIEYAMHLSSAVASVSRRTLLQVHIRIIYIPTVKTNMNADSAAIHSHFLVE